MPAPLSEPDRVETTTSAAATATPSATGNTPCDGEVPRVLGALDLAVLVGLTVNDRVLAATAFRVGRTTRRCRAGRLAPLMRMIARPRLLVVRTVVLRHFFDLVMRLSRTTLRFPPLTESLIRFVFPALTTSWPRGAPTILVRAFGILVLIGKVTWASGPEARACAV